MSEGHEQALREAIARNAGIVLSLPVGGQLCHHKSRFLAAVKDGFWVESAPAEVALVRALAEAGGKCGVSFKSGQSKIIFASPIQWFDDQYPLGSDSTVHTILLRFPSVMRVIQRRSNHRVSARARRAGFAVRMWRMGKRAALGDMPLDSQELRAEVRDLSIGGVGLLLKGKGNQPPLISREDRLRIELHHQGQTLLLEGRLRHLQSATGSPSVRAGIQFIKVVDRIQEVRNVVQLTKLVGELQREEVRRIRLGLTSAA